MNMLTMHTELAREILRDTKLDYQIRSVEAALEHLLVAKGYMRASCTIDRDHSRKFCVMVTIEPATWPNQPVREFCLGKTAQEAVDKAIECIANLPARGDMDPWFAGPLVLQGGMNGS